MSLHLDQQCQRATKTDASANPFFSGRPWRLVFAIRFSNRAGHRCGDTHLGGPPLTVKYFLQLSYTPTQKPRFSASLRTVRLRQVVTNHGGSPGPATQTWRRIGISTSSGCRADTGSMLWRRPLAHPLKRRTPPHGLRQSVRHEREHGPSAAVRCPA